MLPGKSANACEITEPRQVSRSAQCADINLIMLHNVAGFGMPAAISNRADS
jgi:hypothetical protein